MKYANEKTRKAFCGEEDYGFVLALLELSFSAALPGVEFVCTLGADNAKIVAIYRGGFLQRMQSIEGNSLAQVVKDVAEAVRV